MIREWLARLEQYDRRIRLILLLLFTGVITLYGVLDRHYVDYYGTVERTMAASNAGHYFQMTTLDPDNPYVPFTEPLDYGEAILMSLDAVIGRTLTGGAYQVSTIHIYLHLLGLFVLAAILFLIPDKPLLTSICGLVALMLAVLLGPMGFTTSRLWGPAYMVFVVASLTLTLIQPQMSGWRILNLILSGLLIGLSVFIRQSGMGIVQVLSLLLVLISLLMIAVSLYKLRSWPATWAALKDLLTPILWMLVTMQAGAVIVHQAVRAMYALALSLPFGKVEVIKHGLGHPIYLGLGYIANPYNIAWADQIGEIHVHLIDPSVQIYDSVYQSLMLDRWWAVVIESPWLLIGSAFAKLGYLHTLLSGGFAPFPEHFQITNQPAYLVIVYVLAWLALALTLWRMLRTPSLSRLLLLVSFAGIVLGALASPLITHPGLASSVQAATLAVLFLMPAAFYTSHSLPATALSLDQERAILRQISIVTASLILIGMLVGGLWLNSRRIAFQRQQSALITADPAAILQDRRYQIEPFFNALPEEQKREFITGLEQGGGAQIGIIQPDQTSPDFTPLALILSPGQIHLFAHFGAYPEPFERQWQGNTDTILRIQLEGCGFTGDELAYWINNEHWTDSDRMLSLALPAQIDASDRGLTATLELRGLRRISAEVVLSRTQVHWVVCPSSEGGF